MRRYSYVSDENIDGLVDKLSQCSREGWTVEPLTFQNVNSRAGAHPHCPLVVVVSMEETQDTAPRDHIRRAGVQQFKKMMEGYSTPMSMPNEYRIQEYIDYLLDLARVPR